MRNIWLAVGFAALVIMVALAATAAILSIV